MTYHACRERRPGGGADAPGQLYIIIIIVIMCCFCLLIIIIIVIFIIIYHFYFLQKHQEQLTQLTICLFSGPDLSKEQPKQLTLC